MFIIMLMYYSFLIWRVVALYTAIQSNYTAKLQDQFFNCNLIT